MKDKIVKILKLSMLLVPFILGIAGFVTGNHFEFSNAIYSSLRLFVLECDTDSPNLILNIARFLAPIGSAVGISYLVTIFRHDFIMNLMAKKDDTYLVYGENILAKRVLGELGNHGIDLNNEQFIKGSNYILLSERDTDNLEYYERNAVEMNKAHIYMRLTDISRQNISDPHIITFSTDEYVARSFFERDDIFRMVKERRHLRLAFSGFGNLGMKMLDYALQMNLFFDDQQIEYHVFGEPAACRKYKALHTELDMIAPDSVLFHDQLDYENIGILRDMDCIILCGEEKQNMVILSDILTFFPDNGRKIFIRTTAKDNMGLIGSGTETFGADDEAETVLSIVTASADIDHDARQIHESYRKENPSSGIASWEELDSFRRSSNISQAEYNIVRRFIVKDDADAGTDIHSPEYIEKMAELEHLRWCRFHYMYNWRYGEKTDKGAHLHCCLVPYKELSEAEKIKDREVYEKL